MKIQKVLSIERCGGVDCHIGLESTLHCEINWLGALPRGSYTSGVEDKYLTLLLLLHWTREYIW